MTAPPPGLGPDHVSAAVESLALQVDRDTVLQARAVVLAEAQRLRDAIKLHGAGLRVGQCGGDPVSGDAAKAFSERIDALLGHCSRYIRDLESAGAALADAAASYGYTEGDIAASFVA
jgi:hypothetical protein